MFVPKYYYQKNLAKKLVKLKEEEKEKLHQRLNYYNQINTRFELNQSECLQEIKYRKKCKSYFFDMYQIFKYFPENFKMKYIFGDVTHVPEEPAFVKSRPIISENQNAMLLKLNKVRHFVFVNDNRSFEKKHFKIVWRGNLQSNQKNRKLLIEKFHDHPLCNIAHVNDCEDTKVGKGDKLTLYEQLKYQFIMSCEGNDVASNLKWIMSSNSIAVMPKPKYETWFMEGTLIPDYHYILVKDDFSDLIDKVTYYHNNPLASKEIIRNANKHVEQFKNKKQEQLLSLLVMDKYFKLQKTTNYQLH